MTLFYIVQTLLTILPLIIAIAYYTLLERKLIAGVQRRMGPKFIGVWGLLQPLADGLKAFLKEIIIPSKSKKITFILAPISSFVFALLNWIIIPINIFSGLTNFNISILFFLALSSLGILGVFLSGWASNSKYALLGSFRAIAQMISYELSIGLLILPIIIFTGSFNIVSIFFNQTLAMNFWLFWPNAILFLICILAENNRTPFDLPEAEAEIVAGYNLEYSSITFALFFLGEYANMLFNSTIFVLLFFGNSFPETLTPFFFLASTLWCVFKIILVCILYVLIRACLPRYRFDQLILIGWKTILPLSGSLLIFYLGLAFFFDVIPYNEFLILSKIPL